MPSGFGHTPEKLGDNLLHLDRASERQGERFLAGSKFASEDDERSAEPFQCGELHDLLTHCRLKGKLEGVADCR
jgi:hypothetical protein